MSRIPEGYTTITPYVIYDDVVTAIDFYKKALGATEKLRLATPDGQVMHAEIMIGNACFMMGTACHEYGGKSAKSYGGSPVSFYVYVTNLDDFFAHAKKAGMIEKEEIKEMFWGDRMGTLEDSFHVQWTIAEHVRDVSPEEMAAAMKNMDG